MSPSHPTATRGHLTGLLRLEALGMLAIALGVYQTMGFSWGWFALLFLVPDLSLLAYLHSPKVGALAYNTFHAALLPIALLAYALLTHTAGAERIALIWIAHIGFDRGLGYGLKYAQGFQYTHLGIIGRDAGQP